MGGVQIYVNKSSFEPHAWAVRDGDVAAVPDPASYILFLSGLAAMAGSIHRRKAAAFPALA